MANAAKRLKYEDYADNLPALLERVDQEHDVVELERNGRVYRFERIEDNEHDSENIRATSTN